MSLKINTNSIFGLSLEWNITACCLGLLSSPSFLHISNDHLVDKLKKRFRAMAIINGLLLPLIAVFLLMYIFFRYAEEIKRSPGTFLSRQYSRYAKYMLRQYNELPHLFQQRLNQSFEHAVAYVEQFPNEVSIALARFFAFVCSAVVTVLLFLAFLNQDFLTHVVFLEQTPLFFIGVLGSLIAISRNMIPSEHTLFSPETHLTEVIRILQYCPSHWQGQFNSKQVFREFCSIFPLKFEVLLHEMISLIMTPYLLWTKCHDKSEEMIDLFKSIAIDHPELGLVCKYGCFDLQETQDLKMEASILNFKKDYPLWHMEHEPTRNDMVLSMLKESIHLQVPNVEGNKQKPIEKEPMKLPVEKRPKPTRAVTDPITLNDQIDLPFAQVDDARKPLIRRDIQKPFNLSASEVRKK